MSRQQDQQVSDTPFASVLTAYMWSRQPPWSAAKTAAVLGIHRARVAKWVYGGITPEIETMLVVMARLNIPMRFLLDAYAARGIPVPPLDVTPELQSAQEEARASSVNTIGEAASQFYRVPPARRGRGGGKGNAAGVPASSYPATSSATSTAASPAPEQEASEEAAVTRQAQRQHVEEQLEEREWDTMVAHTRKVMAMGQMPASVIESMLAEIEDARAGKPSVSARRIAEEHAPSQEQPAEQPERQERLERQRSQGAQRQHDQHSESAPRSTRHPHTAR